MKVVVVSTTIFTCPPKGYAGLEMVAYQQAVELQKHGHQVMLVAPRGSVVPEGIEIHETTLMEHEQQAYGGFEWRMPEKADVIIDNSWMKWPYMGLKNGKFKAPVLGVMHAPCETMYKVPPPVPKPCIVTISKDQGESAKQLWKTDYRVAYNGVDLEFYRPQAVERGPRYLFLARMSTIKGPHLALEVAKKAGAQLDLVGDDKFTGEVEYANRIRSECNGQEYIYHGGVEREKAVEFYSKAKAMLHLVRDFKEPFGLAPVEAQACGCPVISWDNGAMRETIEHGKTGFLVKSIEEAVDLIKTNAVDGMDRAYCREWAKQFSVENFGKRYDELIKEAVGGGW